ncbi:phytanoyl-CoA dioxygenase family protein [Rhodococcus sp. NM-2]|uniref:phytanoyl-CoA dioxygenase family protein n=1 Tax=Rhodococcus sp. NM-2 TaxID=3401174 RepID=UPI003AAF0A85
MIDESVKKAFWEDGATVVRNFLNLEQLAELYEVFKWNVANPGPFVFRRLDGTSLQTHIDNANPAAKERLDELMTRLPFGEFFAELWDSEHVWYYAEEVFVKENGASGRGPFHQDTSNLPWAGPDWGNAWISFQHVPKKNSLEIVRGSWKGIEYDGASFANADDPTEPLYGDGSLPRLPWIDKDLEKDPNSWDLVSFEVNPGDVVFLHPRSLHGGAAVDADCPDRHTLVLRFFGDDATFRELPKSNPRYARNGVLFTDEMAKLNAGDAFRSQVFQQLV